MVFQHIFLKFIANIFEKKLLEKEFDNSVLFYRQFVTY